MKFHFTKPVAAFLISNPVISAIQNRAEARSWWEYQEWVEENPFGFYWHDVEQGTAKVLFNDKLNVVVKFDGANNVDLKTGFMGNIIPKKAIPTASCAIKTFRGKRHSVRVQPMADVSPSARRLADQKLVNLHFTAIGFDYGDANIGMYQGKPVVIDW
jgi:hypothetical protein